MNPESFDELGVDAMTGSEIMGLLGLQGYQLADPITFGKISEVVNYLKNIPDRSFFVNRITAGKPVDKLNHVWSYIQVLGKKDHLVQELKKVEEEQSIYER